MKQYFAIVLCLLVTGFGLAQIIRPKTGRSDSASQSNSASVRSAAGQFRFVVENGEPQLEVYANGVPIGKTPFELSATELVRQIPPTDKYRAEFNDKARVWNVDPRFDSQGLSKPRSVESLRLDLYSVPSAFAESDEGYSTHLYSKVMFEVRRGDEIGYFRSGDLSQRSESDGAELIRLTPQFEGRQTAIGMLLDIARMQDYEPSDEWYDAFQSYGSSAWRRLVDECQHEPELVRFGERIARQRYKLRGDESSDEAWSALNAIASDAVHEGMYDVRSCRGWALNQIAPLVDGKALSNELLKWLDQTSYSGLYRGKLQSLATPFRRFRKQSKSSIMSALLLHAVKRYDEVADSVSDADNEMESILVPALLKRKEVQKEFGIKAHLARVIGGTAADARLLQQDWKTPYQPPSDGYEIRNFGLISINDGFKDLITVDSARGRKFRNEHRERLFQHLDDSLTKQGNIGLQHLGIESMFPGHLNCLFLDVGHSDTPSLAMLYWPRFSKIITSEINQTHLQVERKWDYLARMWPESKIEMFLDAHPDGAVAGQGLSPYSYAELLPAALSDETAFELLDRLKAKLKQAGVENQILKQIVWVQKDLNCDAGADRFIEIYEASTQEERTAESATDLDRRISKHPTRTTLVQRMVQHKIPQLRLLALDMILKHPTVDGLKLLNQLNSDDDKAVREKARSVQSKLDALLKQKLPTA